MAAAPARFGRVVVLTEDPVVTADAYRAAFAWTTLADVETPAGVRYLHVGPEDQAGVGIWFLEPQGEEARARVGAQTGGEPLLVLYADDLDAATARAAGAGMGVDGRSGEDATSRWRHLRDPLGNGIVLVQLAP